MSGSLSPTEGTFTTRSRGHGSKKLNMEARVCFCRFTQFSLLRLLTTQAVMGADEVMTQTRAWQTFDRWLTDSRVVFLDEPPNLDGPFRSFSSQNSPNPKPWADSYLAAFAAVSGMCLVTFDQAFQGKIKRLANPAILKRWQRVTSPLPTPLRSPPQARSSLPLATRPLANDCARG